jgi:Fis family transcriptional regulator
MMDTHEPPPGLSDTPIGPPPAPAQGRLAQQVQQAVEEYLAHTQGVAVVDLHALFLAEVERPLLRTVLTHCQGNQTRAAALLGMNRATLRKKMRLLGLS